jgi:hypothetical protein
MNGILFGYENTWKCIRAGSSATDRGAVVARRPNGVRSSEAGGGLVVGRETLEGGSRETRSGRPGRQASSGQTAAIVAKAAAKTRRFVETGSAGSRLRNQLVDVSSGGRIDPTALGRGVPSGPCLEGLTQPGMDGPKTPAQGPGARRGGHRSLAEAPMAPLKKSPAPPAVRWCFSMKADSCCSLC